jgi:hypothetical protein
MFGWLEATFNNIRSIWGFLFGNIVEQGEPAPKEYLTPNWEDTDNVKDNIKVVENKSYTNRIHEQFLKVDRRIRFHLESMKFYIASYFMTLMMIMICGAISSITLLLITKHGWDKANEFIITTFLVIAPFTALFTSFPSVFENEKNLSAHKALYIRYDALADEIISYLNTGEVKRDVNIIQDLKIGRPDNNQDRPRIVQKVAAQPNQRNIVSTSKNHETHKNHPGTHFNTGGSNHNTPSPNITPYEKVVDEEESQSAKSKTGIPLTIKEFVHYVDIHLSLDEMPLGFDISKIPSYKEALRQQ